MLAKSLGGAYQQSDFIRYMLKFLEKKWGCCPCIIAESFNATVYRPKNYLKGNGKN